TGLGSGPHRGRPRRRCWRTPELGRPRCERLPNRANLGGRQLEFGVASRVANEGTQMSTITQDNLEGQRALVTGATSGIGRGVALQLAQDDAEVLVHGRDAVRGAATVQDITTAGGKASFVAADLADAADVQRLASEVGAIDILINNAGISRFGPTAEFDVAAFDKMFAS